MKNSRAVIEVRQNDLVKLLQQNGRMSVEEIAERLNVTMATVRRDLAALEPTGVLRRGFGTAEYVHRDNMRDIEPTNVEDEKALVRRKLARQAASMIDDGDVVFVNSSGTASLVLEYLEDKRVTILTNNARIINRSYPSSVHLLLVGGEVYGRKQSLIGQFALDTINLVKANKCILGISGISGTGGLTSVILPETQVNMLMIQQCQGNVIVVADSSKVGITHNFYSGNLRDVTHLVTDGLADPRSLADIEQHGVQVIKV